ncbi:hypothetical protein C0J52_10868 [Blattella germanica]|nr:hypothetical protein C0J52_10868 [Blattella germanica]
MLALTPRAPVGTIFRSVRRRSCCRIDACLSVVLLFVCSASVLYVSKYLTDVLLSDRQLSNYCELESLQDN